MLSMNRNEDGRWIAEIPELPGVMCYRVSRNDAAAKVEALALRVIADRLDEGEMAASPSLSRRWNVLRHEPSLKAQLILAAPLRIGWRVKRQAGSHRTLTKPNWPDVVFASHDGEEIGPKVLTRLAKQTGLSPEDLR
jgi:predicted RNA binding protein YcfA (HicA-like mRNA interferase family)/predicted RNase H-like HicB family nuclease